MYPRGIAQPYREFGTIERLQGRRNTAAKCREVADN